MSMKDFRTKDGKRLRSPQEFLADQGDDPICKVHIYNRKDKIVVEAWKNMKTKRTHVLKIRRPTDAEEKTFDSLIVREQLMGKENQDQFEMIVAGDDYEKKPLKSN